MIHVANVLFMKLKWLITTEYGWLSLWGTTKSFPWLVTLPNVELFCWHYFCPRISRNEAISTPSPHSERKNKHAALTEMVGSWGLLVYETKQHSWGQNNEGEHRQEFLSGQHKIKWNILFLTVSCVLKLHLTLDLNSILILNVIRKSSLLKLYSLMFT